MLVTFIACQRPDSLGRSLSQWDCKEIAKEVIKSGQVASISYKTVGRILKNHQLKPWRNHMWINPRVPFDEAFYKKVKKIEKFYVGKIKDDEIRLSLDEKTSIQPRKREYPTKPARAGVPNLVEHEYVRKGALHLIAALNTRTGEVFGTCYEDKRQVELIDFLEFLDDEIPEHIKKIRILCDNASIHKGKKILKWLDEHPWFEFQYTPPHCSWINQVEQWFSILQRKRLKFGDFESLDDLDDKIIKFIIEWDENPHPFNWSKKSFDKIYKKCKNVIP
jgi:transposase